jgi:type VI secretion system protein ImpC
MQMPGRIEFEFTTHTRTRHAAPAPSDPMRILVLGDFSGHGLRATPAERPALPQRKLHPVDLDTLDTVLQRIAPALTLESDAGDALPVSFSGLEDFHPDTLLQRLPEFAELRAIRAQLPVPATRDAAAARLRTLLSLQSPATQSAAETKPGPAGSTDENDTSTLERLLGKPTGGPSRATSTARSAVSRLIEAAVGADIVPEAGAALQVYQDATDRALGELLRRVLQYPAFQALEATWRGLDWLVNRLELDENLQLVLLDVTKQELARDAQQAGADLTQSALYRLLVEQGVQVPGTTPWSLLVGHFCFDDSGDDIRLLAMLGGIAAQAGGPFLAQADTTILGCTALAATPDPRDWTNVDARGRERWNALRASTVAPWIGLALPRLLLRLPYGPDTDEIDGCDFREVTDAGEHERFLWGNPALGCAALLGQAFTERSWQMTPGDVRDIGDLPAYVHTTDGEQQLLAGAEVFLTETAAERLLELGLMPLVSLRNTNAARLLRFQSIASPARALAGAWD